MNKPRALQFLLVTITVVGLAACQSPGPANAPARSGADPHAQLEPESAPGQGQKLLAAMAGQWNVVRKFYPRTGDPAITHGTCTQTMMFGGRFLRSDFAFHDADGDTRGQGTIGFDADTGQFTSFWIDSRSTRISIRQSQGKFDGRQIVLFSKALTDTGPGARQSRTVSHLENNGRTLIHQQFGANPDGSERLVMELLMTKK
jgi:hypothetical protein